MAAYYLAPKELPNENLDMFLLSVIDCKSRKNMGYKFSTDMINRAHGKIRLLVKHF